MAHAASRIIFCNTVTKWLSDAADDTQSISLVLQYNLKDKILYNVIIQGD
jgi:myo-inositol catabolism protein IolC